jgi:NAD(P)-dependent dehydrogenase (short-subunit alcohol dehydrogenase family)
MNNVLPGFTDSYPENPENVARIPMGRYALIEEIAAAVAFLVSDQGGYVTGQNLRVDGGLSRSV